MRKAQKYGIGNRIRNKKMKKTKMISYDGIFIVSNDKYI